MGLTGNKPWEDGWQRVIEGLFDSTPDERQEIVKELQSYVDQLPKLLEQWETDEKEADGDLEPPYDPRDDETPAGDD